MIIHFVSIRWSLDALIDQDEDVEDPKCISPMCMLLSTKMCVYICAENVISRGIGFRVR